MDGWIATMPIIDCLENSRKKLTHKFDLQKVPMKKHSFIWPSDNPEGAFQKNIGFFQHFEKVGTPSTL